MSSTLLFYGAFTTGGGAATDLTVTVDVVRITRSDGTQTASVNGGSATQVTTPNKNGLYLYQLTGADLTLYDYVAAFKTAGTCDLNRIPAAYVPVSADLISILQAVLTETSGGYLAAAFKKLFDVAAPVFTAAAVNQTGDGYARLGAPAGASIAADLAEIEAETDDVAAVKAKTDQLAFTVAGHVDATTTASLTLDAATLAGFFTTNTTKHFADAVSGSVVYEIKQGVTTGPGVVISDDTSGKTINSQATGAVSASEIFARTDVRVLADLCSDTGSRLGSPTDTALMKTALLASSVFTKICDDAMGIVEQAAQVGKRYSAADLTALLASGTVSAAGLYRVLSRVVVVLAYERRPDLEMKLPWVYEEASDMIQKLADGQRILSFVEVAEAGNPSSRVETARDVENRNGAVVQGRRLFGRRSNRNDPA